MALTPELLKRIMYSKYLLQRAQALSAEGHELALGASILTAHDAVEMVMKVVTDTLNVQWAHDFKKFWSLVEQKTSTLPPRLGAMDQLNDDRNGFKHKGILPNPANVSDRLRNSFTFCEEISQQYLNVDYQSLSLADLIQNIAARTKIKEAESAKESGNLATAITTLGLAFDDLLSEGRKKHGEALVGHIPVLGRDFVQTVASESLKSKLHKVAETVDSLILGIDLAKLRRFSEITPIRQHSVSGQVFVTWIRDSNGLTVEDFNFCRTFVIDFGLQLL
jgi:hypothetical protein